MVAERKLLSAWMRKGGMLSRALQRDSRLLLTIDFASQVLCIHTSVPVPFRDILQVEPLGAASRLSLRVLAPSDAIASKVSGIGSVEGESSAQESSMYVSVRSLTSSLSDSTLPWREWQYGFVLSTKHNKKLQLRCASATEAAQWVAALRQAMSDAEATASTNTSKAAVDEDAALWAAPSPSRLRAPDQFNNSTSPELQFRCRLQVEKMDPERLLA